MRCNALLLKNNFLSRSFVEVEVIIIMFSDNCRKI